MSLLVVQFTLSELEWREKLIISSIYTLAAQPATTTKLLLHFGSERGEEGSYKTEKLITWSISLV